MFANTDLHKRLFLGFLAICCGAIALCLGMSVSVAEAGTPGVLRSGRLLVLVLIALLTLLACSGAATYVIRAALKPLADLRESVRASARTRYETPVAPGGAAEVDDLAREIESLREDLTTATRRYRATADRIVELSRLPGMIDPREGEADAARSCLEFVLRALHGVAGAVYLLDEAGATLTLTAGLGLQSTLADDTRTLPSTHGFMGRALTWGQALVLDEESAAEWLMEVRDADSGPAAVACVPLKSVDRSLGVLNLVLRPGEALAPEEVGMLETIAAQMGATLVNARVFGAAQRRLAHIAALLDTSAEVARGRRTRQVLDLVLAKVRELTGVRKCAVFLLRDEENLTCRVATHAGLSDEFLARIGTQSAGPTQRALRELRPVAVSAVSVDPSVADLYVTYRDEGIESLLAVPLLGADHTYGTVEVYRSAKGSFSSEDVQLLSILANQAAIALTNAQLHEQSLNRLAALETIVQTLALFGASSDPQQIVQTAVRKAREVFRCQTCLVCFRNHETGLLELQGAVGVPESGPFRETLIRGLDPARCWAVQKGTAFIVRDARWDLRCEQEPEDQPPGSYICAPLTAGGQCFGVMRMTAEGRRRFSEEEVQLFTTIAEQVAIAAQRAQLFQQVQELATTDPMTGAHNYRRFREELTRELHEARRYRQPLSLLILDVDHFKQHNDTYGHPSGDQVLRRLAQVTRRCLRTVDLFARYGGEEFVVVLPQTARQGACAVAEKVRAAVEGTTFYGDPDTPEVRKTISVGVASFPEDGETDETLIAAADRALYRAKEGGRNRVETAAPPPPSGAATQGKAAGRDP